MTEKTYQIVVSGQLTAGAILAQVKEKVANLFNAPTAKLEPLFSGQRIVVKKGLDQAAAQRYVAALQEAGLLSVAETLAGDASSSANANHQPVNAMPQPSLAPAGTTLIERTPVAAPDIDTRAYSMSPVGITLVTAIPVPAPVIDVSALSVSPLGVDMVEAAPVAAPDIDVSALSMSSPGTRLGEPPMVHPPVINTSAFDLSPAGSDVDQRKPGVTPLPPDTHHLKLV